LRTAVFAWNWKIWKIKITATNKKEKKLRFDFSDSHFWTFPSFPLLKLLLNRFLPELLPTFYNQLRIFSLLFSMNSMFIEQIVNEKNFC
jgi:hypothetical protein